jgi:hypothetical protein
MMQCVLEMDGWFTADEVLRALVEVHFGVLAGIRCLQNDISYTYYIFVFA